MKVTFFLISLLLHLVILTAPVFHMEKTREEIFPVTFVLQTATTTETQSANSTPPRKNRIAKSAIKRLKRARTEKVKTSKSTAQKMARYEEKPLRQEATISHEKGVVDRPLGPAHFDPAPHGHLRPSSMDVMEKPQLGPKNVEEEKETIVEAHFSDRGNEKQTTPQPIFLGAKYAYVSKPEYPERARREGWEGTVLLAILVDTEGRPERIVLNRSSGFGVLDTAAQETVKRWRFQPAQYGRTRVQSWVKVPIVFTLTEAKN